jgi:hypothetical protein
MGQSEITRHIRLFHYFILMPDEIQMQDSIFNRFSRNLTNSMSVLNFISQLPASIDEYIGDWPISGLFMPYDVNYQIHYIYESNVAKAVSSSEMFKLTPFGCVFVMENVTESSINALREVTTLPFVYCEEDCGENFSLYDSNLIVKLHKFWSDKTDYWLSSVSITQRPRWVKNQTNYRSFSAPSVAFFEPLVATVDRVRGLYEATQQGVFVVPPCEPSNFKEKEEEADTLINDLIRRILAEKFVMTHVGYLQEESFDEADRRRLSRLGINESELRIVLRNRDDVQYLKLVESVLEQWDNVDMKSEFVLCVPSVNFYMLNMLNDLLKKEKLPRKILRQIYDHANYYQVFESKVFDAESEEKRLKNFMNLQNLIIERGKELRFLSSIHVLYTLARRIPYIRTRNVPASNFFRLADALSAYCDDMEERNKIPDFVKGMKEIATHIKSSFHIDTLNLLQRHAIDIKAISDLPVEWIELDGLPLCVACNYSRVPITPGNGLVGHANIMNREYILSEENVNVLLINTLKKDDKLFGLGRALRNEINHYFKLIGKEITYAEITKGEEFLNKIEKEKPTIFIYYGHGKYDDNEMVGRLEIGDEYVTSLDIEQLSWKPLITLLGACETQVMHGTHLNVANLFLGGGCVSVLGTYFPVYGLHALTFITNIMRHLVNCFVHAAPDSFERWDNILLQTYRTQYLLDSMHAMDRYLGVRGKTLNSYSIKPLNMLWEQGEKNGYQNAIDFYRNRDILFQQVFDTVPELGEAYRRILENNLILPQCLYYSSLGSPEKIKIKRGNKVHSFVDVTNHYQYYGRLQRT